MNNNRLAQWEESGLWVGFTAIFVGYLSVWLPGPGAGLSFLGVELGEWIKFLGLGQSRNWFYLPPITLGLCMVLATAVWPNGRWQTWAMRFGAVAVSWLAFPAIEAIRYEPSSEWLLRLCAIGLVVLVALGIGFWRRWPRTVAGFLLVLGLLGAILPTWMYGIARGMVAAVLNFPPGIGLGVWLNGAGHLLVTAVAVLKIKRA